jgi:hypothetical protein
MSGLQKPRSYRSRARSLTLRSTCRRTQGAGAEFPESRGRADPHSSSRLLRATSATASPLLRANPHVVRGTRGLTRSPCSHHKGHTSPGYVHGDAREEPRTLPPTRGRHGRRGRSCNLRACRTFLLASLGDLHTRLWPVTCSPMTNQRLGEPSTELTGRKGEAHATAEDSGRVRTLADDVPL